MTAGELAVLMAAVLCCIGFAALIVVLMRVLDAMRELRDEMKRLRETTEPLMRDLRGSVEEARASVDEAREDLERFDRVLGSAEAISDAVSGGSRVVRHALSAPVIKTVAFASGTRKGARRLARQEHKALKRGRKAS
jgi:uncharacterized protein YoxC